MKTLFLSLIALLSVQNIIAQYTFSMYNQPYQDLTNPISLNNNMTWEFPNYTIPIGFDFYFANDALNTFYISSAFSPAIIVSSTNLTNTISEIIPFGIGICDRNINYITFEPELGSASPISYQLTGNVGNRIFKLEYKNVGFENDIWVNDERASDYANFQLWCYETSNIVEFRYGDSHFEHFSDSFNDETGPLVCVLPFANINGPTQNGIILQGAADNPSVSYSTSVSYINGVPPNGTVYRFTPITASIQQENKKNLCSIAPNPAQDFFKIQNIDNLKEGYIYDTFGKLVFTFYNNTVDISHFTKGMYLVKTLDSSQRVFTNILLVH